MADFFDPATGPRARRFSVAATTAQLQVIEHPARFKSVFASRRFGKSTTGLLWLGKGVSRYHPDGGVCWWISPVYSQARKPFNKMARLLRAMGILAPDGVHRAEMRLETTTNWEIVFRSADRPDNLLGEGVDLLVVDEAGVVKDEVWTECLRPMLADTKGKLLAIGTPRFRRGWAWRGYERGLAGGSEWGGFKFTVEQALFVSKEEAEAAKRDMPDLAYRQEFMAEFLDPGGVVFSNVRTRRAQPVMGEGLGLGVDWAKKRDWTAFSLVGAQSGAVYSVRRIQGVSYTSQVEELVKTIDEIRNVHGVEPYVAHDQTGVGEAMDDMLAAAGVQAEGVMLTNSSKQELIEESVFDFEAGRLGWVGEEQSWSAGVRQAVAEHEWFTAELTPGGTRVRYAAPEGLNDDTVISVALANRGRRLSARAGQASVWSI